MNTAELIEAERGKLPPMLEQYLEYKRKHPDCLMLFQVGDFYEVFFDDAVTVAKALNLTLTSRDKNSPNPIPMCGVPVGVVDSYAQRLVAQGFAVAIVSQSGAPANGKGMFERRLDRIVTPGVQLLSDAAAEGGESICALSSSDGDKVGLAIVYPQSGRVLVREDLNPSILRSELSRLRPSEFLVPENWRGILLDQRFAWLVKGLAMRAGVSLVRFRPLGMSSTRAFGDIEGYAGLGQQCRDAVRMLLTYLDETTVAKQISVKRVDRLVKGKNVEIDAPTRVNLELLNNSRDGSSRGTLYEYLSATVTAAGARQLRTWIAEPIFSKSELSARYDAVGRLSANDTGRETVRDVLKKANDLERIAARSELGIVSPKELAALRDCFVSMPLLQQRVADLGGERLTALSTNMTAPEDLVQLLSRSLNDNVPHLITDGGVFRDGYDPELDRLRGLGVSGQAWLTDLENRERERSGINSLKVKFNSVLGYFIEITATHRDTVPSDYIPRQRTANTGRFVTPELAERQQEVLNAHDLKIAREKILFDELRLKIQPFAGDVRRIGAAIAEVDVLAAFAFLTQRDVLCRPEICEDSVLEINNCWHPVVARLSSVRFVRNSIALGVAQPRCLIVTGPNMGGKSTYLRQTAIAVIMAQIGCFAPAESMRFGLVDQIFARIGASDDLSEGDSTFMVEMREASNILRSASYNSLVLIDEIGRGTATADGLAIAQAILESLVVSNKSRTIFATHFHDLTKLESLYPPIQNVSVGSVDKGEQVFFTHQILKGPANRSYGIEVAKMAGISTAIIKRARGLLNASVQDNANGLNNQGQMSVFSLTAAPAQFEGVDELKELRDAVLGFNLNSATPLQAMAVIEAWQKIAKKSAGDS